MVVSVSFLYSGMSFSAAHPDTLPTPSTLMRTQSDNSSSVRRVGSQTSAKETTPNRFGVFASLQSSDSEDALEDISDWQRADHYGLPPSQPSQSGNRLPSLRGLGLLAHSGSDDAALHNQENGPASDEPYDSHPILILDDEPPSMTGNQQDMPSYEGEPLLDSMAQFFRDLVDRNEAGPLRSGLSSPMAISSGSVSREPSPAVVGAWPETRAGSKKRAQPPASLVDLTFDDTPDSSFVDPVQGKEVIVLDEDIEMNPARFMMPDVIVHSLAHAHHSRALPSPSSSTTVMAMNDRGSSDDVAQQLQPASVHVDEGVAPDSSSMTGSDAAKSNGDTAAHMDNILKEEIQRQVFAINVYLFSVCNWTCLTLSFRTCLMKSRMKEPKSPPSSPVNLTQSRRNLALSKTYVRVPSMLGQLKKFDFCSALASRVRVPRFCRVNSR